MNDESTVLTVALAFTKIDSKSAEAALAKLIDQHFDGDDELVADSLMNAYRTVTGHEFEL